MKILHIGKYYPPYFGGMETFLQDLVLAQVATGMNVEVLVHNHQGCKTACSANSKAADEILSPEVTRVGTLGRFFFTPVSPGFRAVLQKRIREFQPDVLHLHMPNPSAFLVMTIADAKKIPWVVHWHADVVSSDLDWRVKLAYRFYKPFEQALLSRATSVVATSDAYLNSSKPLEKWREKCTVIPLGMAAQRLLPTFSISAEIDWSGDGLHVLAVGRLTYYKGFEYLLRAVAETNGVEVKIVGVGEKEQELLQLISELDVMDRVKLLGRQSDGVLGYLMNTCDCLCLPSIERTEAFGMVLLEAMQFSKPTLVSDVPGSGMGWVVQHDETGLKVAPGNVAELAEGLRYFVRNPDLLQKMGRKARSRFDRIFRIEEIERQVAGLYERVLGER